jgi:hypothetical protein
MRWLIALGLVVAACSGSGTDGPSNAPEGAGDAGEASPGAGKGGATATAGTASGGAGGESIPAEGGAGGALPVSSSGAPAGVSGAGTGGESEAGQGGSSVATAGAGSTGGIGPAPQAGSGGEAGSSPDPDACAGVPAWDETVPWTALTKDELRTLRGELWKCSSPAFCTTHPGHETAPGWVKVDDCADSNEGGEPACQCEEGACCDGCFFRPRAHFCGEVLRSASCHDEAIPSCGGGQKDIDRDYWNLFCNGDTGGDCTRWGAHTKFTYGTCPQGTGCIESGDQASCVACP